MQDAWTKVLHCLSSKGALSIMLYLAQEDQGVNLSQLVRNIPAVGKLAINNAVMCLVLTGLVADERVSAHNQRVINLTPLGKSISKHLLAIRQEIKS